MDDSSKGLNVDEQQRSGTVPGRMHLTRETRVVLLAFLFSGAAALIYEVTWTRALSLVLGSTVYALSTMLATFMGGLALGSYLGGKLSDRVENQLYYFGLCELGIGLTGMISIPLIYALPDYYIKIYRSFHLYPSLFFTIQISMCIVIMIVPTTLMGATFPLVSKRITRNLSELGRSVGDAYSFNTIGAVMGSLSVGFLFIPLMGVKGSAFIAAAMNMLIGCGMLVLSGRRIKTVLLIALPLYLLLSPVLSFSSTSGTLLSFYTAYRITRDEVPFVPEKTGLVRLYEKSFPEGLVRAYRSSFDGSLILQSGGKLEGSSPEEYHHTSLLSYLPIAAHPNPVSYLNIGLGAGVTLEAAKGHVEDIDVVEINPGIIQAVDLYGKKDIFKGVRVMADDGRNYLLKTEKKYDIITIGISYPTEAGASNLFTKEFYKLVASKLKKGGIVSQSVPYYLLTNDDVTMVLKTFGSVYHYVYLWKTPLSLDLILLGRQEPFSMDEKTWRAKVDELNTSPYTLEYVLSRTPEQVAKIVSDPDVPITTDDHPRLEFNAVNNLLLGNLALKEEEQNPGEALP